jgi:hypothetical protein
MEHSNSQSDLSFHDAVEDFESIPKKSPTEKPLPTTDTAAALNPQDTIKEEQYIQEIQQSLSHFQHSANLR